MFVCMEKHSCFSCKMNCGLHFKTWYILQNYYSSVFREDYWKDKNGYRAISSMIFSKIRTADLRKSCRVVFFFFPMISFCIYYNWKWSHFYLDTLFLVCTFKFHRTVLQHLYPLKTTITRAIWKVILQARTDKNSLFCRLWKSQTIIVILVGEGVCDNKRQIIPTDFNYAVKTWGWFVAFFIKMWKLISTNFYCFAVVTYIYTFTDSVLFGLFLFGPKSN